MKVLTVLSAARLMSRDLEVLKYLAPRRIVKASDIKERFWPTGAHKNHFVRLARLRDLGLICRVQGDNGARLGYRITPEGLRCLGEWDPKYSEHRLPKPMRPSTYEHDLLLGRLQEVFESCSAVSDFMPEHEVRSALVKKHGIFKAKRGDFKVPDALFKLQTRSGKFDVALELELAQKAVARYRKLLRLLLTSDDYQVVFVVTKGERLRSFIETQLEFVRNNDLWVKVAKTRASIYFVTLDELLGKGKDAVWHGESSSLRLSDFEKAPKRVHNPGYGLGDAA